MENNDKYTADLPGHTADGGGTIPADICVTAHKPDLKGVQAKMQVEYMNIHLSVFRTPMNKIIYIL